MAHNRRRRTLIWCYAFAWAFILAGGLSANCATQSKRQVTLKASNNSPSPGERITVTATLQPSERDARYFFEWGDNTSAAGMQMTDTAAHSYSAAGAYVVTVRVENSDHQFLANATINVTVNNPITFSLPAYRVQLTTDRSSAKVGEQITYSAKVTPEAPGLSFVFEWTTGSSSEQSSSQTATHAYERPGQYKTRVIVYKDGKRVASSNLVTVQVQEVLSSLTLERLGGTLNTRQNDTFTVKLDPEPLSGISVEYCFMWSDGSGDECGSATKRLHAYSDAGTYQVSVAASLNKGARIFSQPLEVTVQKLAPSTPAFPIAHPSSAPKPLPGYRVIVKAESLKQVKGKAVFVEAVLTPKPRPGSRVQYCFAWKEGPDAPCQTAPFGTHMYTAAGTYDVQAAAIVDGASTDLSPAIEVTVISSGRSILITGAIILGTLAAAMGLHQSQRFFRLKVTAKADSGRYRIAKAKELQIGLHVHVRCVPQNPTLRMKPVNIVEKVKGATHV